VVDLASVGVAERPGAFQLGRARNTIALLGRYLTHLPRARRLYMTIATSRLGFLRDAFFIWSAHLLRRRIVIHHQGGGCRRFYLGSGRLFRAVIRSTLARADTLVVLGDSLRSQFRFVPDAKKRVVVVRNCLPVSDPSLLMEQKTLPETGPVRLLYLSNMIPSKGYWDLLHACRKLKNAGIDFRCDYCGDFLDIVDPTGSSTTAAAAENQFRKAIEEFGLSERVTYHGSVHGSRKIELLRAAHMFVLPTYYPWEGQPMSIIEAMAAATPVISTRHRAIPDQVIDGDNGFLVKTRSPADIAQAVTRLATDRDLFAKQSGNAHRHFREHFGAETHLNRLIGVILDARLPD
jgi:glycosyltransferase involved in cell wall biosynthesis